MARLLRLPQHVEFDLAPRALESVDFSAPAFDPRLHLFLPFSPLPTPIAGNPPLQAAPAATPCNPLPANTTPPPLLPRAQLPNKVRTGVRSTCRWSRRPSYVHRPCQRHPAPPQQPPARPIGSRRAPRGLFWACCRRVEGGDDTTTVGGILRQPRGGRLPSHPSIGLNLGQPGPRGLPSLVLSSAGQRVAGAKRSEGGLRWAAASSYQVH